jgi:hypothetical protein
MGSSRCNFTSRGEQVAHIRRAVSVGRHPRGLRVILRPCPRPTSSAYDRNRGSLVAARARHGVNFAKD